MNKKTKGILITLIGVFIIIGSAVIVFFVFDNFSFLGETALPEPTQIPVVTVEVLVASRDLFIGQMLEPGDVKIAEVPAEIVPRNALTDPEETENKFLKTDLIQGEIMLESNLADPTNINHDIGFILSENHILMAFPAGDLMSQESIIQRGDIVDILVSMSQTVEKIGETPAEDEEDAEETLLFTFDAMQRVGVTAMVMDLIYEEPDESTPQIVGNEEDETTVQTTSPRRDYNIRAYLFALEPQEALLLKHLKDAGATFDIVLRNPTSTTYYDLTPVTAEYIVELYGLEIIP